MEVCGTLSYSIMRKRTKEFQSTDQPIVGPGPWHGACRWPARNINISRAPSSGTPKDRLSNPQHLPFIRCNSIISSCHYYCCDYNYFQLSIGQKMTFCFTSLFKNLLGGPTQCSRILESQNARVTTQCRGGQWAAEPGAGHCMSAWRWRHGQPPSPSST